MAQWQQINEAEWQKWLSERPRVVRDVAARIRPDRLYRLGEHRCYPVSYGEDGTVTVAVTGQFNRVLFSRNVFGIKPDKLTECELPASGEDIGDMAAEAGYTADDIRDILIPRLRARKTHRD